MQIVITDIFFEIFCSLAFCITLLQNLQIVQDVFSVNFENVQGLGGQRGCNDQRSRLVGVINVIRVVAHGGQVGRAVR